MSSPSPTVGSRPHFSGSHWAVSAKNFSFLSSLAIRLSSLLSDVISDCSASCTGGLSPAVMPTVEISNQKTEMQVFPTSVNDYIRLIHPLRVCLLNLIFISTGTETCNLRLATAGLRVRQQKKVRHALAASK